MDNKNHECPYCGSHITEQQMDKVTETRFNSCFVATACYGEHDHITDSLRKWRDTVRNKGTEKGKLLFIAYYYSFLGRPMAFVLRKLPFLKPIARKSIVCFMKINNIKINQD